MRGDDIIHADASLGGGAPHKPQFQQRCCLVLVGAVATPGPASFADPPKCDVRDQLAKKVTIDRDTPGAGAIPLRITGSQFNKDRFHALNLSMTDQKFPPGPQILRTTRFERNPDDGMKRKDWRNNRKRRERYRGAGDGANGGSSPCSLAGCAAPAARGSGPAAPMAPRICPVLPVRGVLDVKAKVNPDRHRRSRPPPPQETADEYNRR